MLSTPKQPGAGAEALGVWSIACFLSTKRCLCRLRPLQMP